MPAPHTILQDDAHGKKLLVAFALSAASQRFLNVCFVAEACVSAYVGAVASTPLGAPSATAEMMALRQEALSRSVYVRPTQKYQIFGVAALLAYHTTPVERVAHSMLHDFMACPACADASFRACV